MIKYLKSFVILFILIVIKQNISAQEIYDLKRCLEIGLDRNYSIRIVKNEQQMAENNATIGNAGYLPTLGLDGSYSGTLNNIKQYMDGENIFSMNGINNQALNANLNLNWTIFDGFNIQANYKRVKEFQEVGKLGTRLTIESFISSTTSEYYNYVRQNIRLANLKSAVALSRERLRIVEERYNIGSMSKLDLQQAKVDFNADSSNLLKQFEVVYASRINLNTLMALDDVEQKLNIKDSVIQPNPFLSKEILLGKTLKDNTSLLLSDKNKVIGELDYKKIVSRNYPYLKLNAGYGYAYNLYEMGSYDKQTQLGLNYGLTLGFTIFDGFNRNREQKNARLDIQNRDLEYQQLELALKADLSNIWMSYQNNWELISLEKENLQTAKENYEIAIERYKLGDLSGIELREAQNSLLSAEERLLVAEFNTKLCEISLMQISGQLSVYLE